MLQAKPFVVVVCCGESMSTEDVVHSEPFVDPSVMERATSWNRFS